MEWLGQSEKILHRQAVHLLVLAGDEERGEAGQIQLLIGVDVELQKALVKDRDGKVQSLRSERFMIMEVDQPVDDNCAILIFDHISIIGVVLPLEHDVFELGEPQLLHLLAPLGLLAVEVGENIIWVPPQLIILETDFLAIFRSLRLRHIVHTVCGL